MRAKIIIKKILYEIIKIICISIRLFPIKKNKIIFWNTDFKKYGCNPKYLTEYLLQQQEKYEIIWVFSHKNNINIPSNVKKINFYSLRYLYELHTSKIIITNSRIRKDFYFFKRKSQIYIQTWHSSLRLKKIEKDAESTLNKDYIKDAKIDSKKCDYLISASKKSTEIFRNAFWYNGEILETGTPRGDFLINNSEAIKSKIKKSMKISEEKRILLYAPTFRNNEKKDTYSFDFDKIIQTLQKKYKKEWVIFYRLHPNIIKKDCIIHKSVYDVSSYNDMQELIISSDILVTDYSSTMFDAALIKKPCFLLVRDLEEYLKNERKFYFNITELPFEIAKSSKELEEKFEQFNFKEYKEKCLKFLENIKMYEDGNANFRIYQLIKKIVKE